MEIVIFLIVMAGIMYFWRVLLVLAAIGFVVMFVRGVFGAFGRIPPADSWQTPWNLVHGQLDSNEIFWISALALIGLLVGWHYLKKAVLNRARVIRGWHA